MSLRSRLRAAFARRKSPAPTTYRTDTETTEQVIDDFEAMLMGLSLRCKVLERQLKAQGIKPEPTPTGSQLLLVADALERRVYLNTLEIKHLAALVRGLAQWTD